MQQSAAHACMHACVAFSSFSEHLFFATAELLVFPEHVISVYVITF